MRPALWRLATRIGLKGWVRNQGGRVRIHGWGSEEALQAFERELRFRPPAGSHIEVLETTPVDDPAPADFRIVPSDGESSLSPLPLDRAVCDHCMAEVEDPGNRRYRYPFTHCADCGPRFSLLRRLPYDRGHTSLERFSLCPQCRQEYDDPGNRRFHAESIVCPHCGPKLWTFPTTSRDPLRQVKFWLRQGLIVAVKGVGGFHLVVDATQGEAVARLRARKSRPHRPLALMARDLKVIRRYCRVGPEEEQALMSPLRPIVLLEAIAAQDLSSGVAPGVNRYGFMLPYTPLHHLLLEDFDTPLVFTSANPSGAPLCSDNGEALTQLKDIADAYLLHDREIIHRIDDSVLQYAAGRMRTVRGGRGVGPLALTLPAGFKDCGPLLAMGGELKSTVCLLENGNALLSPHLGDLEDARTFAWYQREMQSLQAFFGFRPQSLAIDCHPDYLSSRMGRNWATAEGLAVTEVQHHHAHLTACLAEAGHPLEAGPVLGVILDGLGYAGDGTFWGGELLYGDYRTCQRLAWLRPAPLPGGGKALVQPWRNLVARLWQAGMAYEHFIQLAGKPLLPLTRMMENHVQCPLASSVGRLFDAAAAALGIASQTQSYEGQAAAMLESLAWRSRDSGAYSFTIREREIDPAPLWPQMLQDLRAGVAVETMARRFHFGLARVWATLVLRFSAEIGCRTVVLSGGVFQNRLLLESLHGSLQSKGMTVWVPAKVPVGDGGLCLGQAVVGAAAMSGGD